MRKKILFLLPLCISLTSCTIYGLTNDYKKLTEDKKAVVHKLISFDDLQNKHIYEINAGQLKEELKKYDKSIVYIFTNGCSSEKCKPLNIYEAYAEKNNYKIFFIMSGYGHLKATLSQDFNKPLFAIDNKYYKADWRFKYFNRFENDLLNRPIKGKPIEYQGSIYFFEKDKLVKITETLPNENGLSIFK